MNPPKTTLGYKGNMRGYGRFIIIAHTIETIERIHKLLKMPRPLRLDYVKPTRHKL